MKNDSKEPTLMQHEIDGIRELDNLLPKWWVWLFYFTIIFSVVYVGYYHVFHVGDLQAVEFQKEFAKGEEIKTAAIARFETSLGTLEPSKDQAIIALGQQTFVGSCAACHRADGGGLVGPNLCDDYWIHGGKFEDNLKTIWNGVPEKGMVTWRGVLKPDQIYAVASYIYTLRGSNPANPKPREDQAPKDTGPSAFE